MIKGLYSAVSAMMMNAKRQEMLAHNISNMGTPGFKQVMSSALDFIKTPVVNSPGGILKENTQQYVGMLGLGVQNGPQFTDFSQGALDNTGNPLDLALQGDGFFTVKTPEGTRYTRDGRFLRDAQNNLVTVDGNQVLGKNNQPIKLPDGDVSVTADGTINSGAATVGKLAIGFFQNPDQELVRSKGNLFSGPAQPTGKGVPQVAQGVLEASNADPTSLMTEMTEIARSYEIAQKMVQNEDELTGKAIATLGRMA